MPSNDVSRGLISHAAIKEKKRLCGVVAAALTAALSAGGSSTARADLTWDVSGTAKTTGTPTDGSGTWNTTTAEWYDGTNDTSWVNASNDVFGNGGAGGVISLAADFNVGSLTFNQTSGTTGYTIGSVPGEHTLTITDQSDILLNNTARTTIINSTVVSSVGGTGGFTVAGSGNLTFNAAVGTAGVQFPTVTMNGAGVLTFAGSADNYGMMLIADSGTTILAKTGGGHAIGGGMTIAGGTVQLGSAGDNIYDGTGININSGTFDLHGFSETVSGVTAGLQYDNGVFIINSVAGTNSVLTGDINTNGNKGVFNAGGDGNLTFGNVANNGSTITKVGNGILTLTGGGDNVALGVNVNSGTVVFAKTSAAGVHADGGPLVINGGTLQLAGTGGDQIYDGASVTLNTGVFDLNGLNEGINVLAGGGGTVLNNNSGTTATLTIGTLNGDAQTFNGVIADHSSGTGVVALVKTGTGKEVLGGNNTFSGGTLINGGLIQFTGDAQFGAVPAAPTVNITLDGGEIFNNNSTPILNVNRTIALNAGGGFIEAGFGPANTFTVNGKITGVGGLGVAWDGQPLIFTNPANDYAGDTTIGTIGNAYYGPGSALLQFGVNNALPFGPGKGNVVFGTNPTTPAATATLDLHGFNGQINGLTGGSNAFVDNTAGAAVYTLTVGNNNATSVFAGTIRNGSGSLALAKTGAGVLTLSGANTYAGGTLVNAGTLLANNLSANGSTGSNTLTINPGGVLGGGATGTAASGNVNAKGPIVVAAGTTGRGGTVSAGTSSILSPGLADAAADLTTGGQTWTGGASDGSTGGVYAWKLNLSDNSTGATYQSGGLNTAKTGDNWDQLSIQTLSVAASPSNRFNIEIIGLGTDSTSSTGAAGTAFNPGLPYQWVAANVPAGNAFSGVTAANFHIDTTNLPGNVNGTFKVGTLSDFGAADAGFNDVIISYNPAPEPTSLALLAIAAASLALRRRRRVTFL